MKIAYAFLFLLLIPLTTAIEQHDCSIYGTCKTQTSNIIIDINESTLNVNNTDKLDGYHYNNLPYGNATVKGNANANELAYFSAPNYIMSSSTIMLTALGLQTTGATTGFISTSGTANAYVLAGKLQVDNGGATGTLSGDVRGNIIANKNLSAVSLNASSYVTATRYCNSTLCKDLSQWSGMSAMNYTNIAMTNKSNYFTPKQNFTEIDVKYATNICETVYGYACGDVGLESQTDCEAVGCTWDSGSCIGTQYYNCRLLDNNEAFCNSPMNDYYGICMWTPKDLSDLKAENAHINNTWINHGHIYNPVFGEWLLQSTQKDVLVVADNTTSSIYHNLAHFALSDFDGRGGIVLTNDDGENGVDGWDRNILQFFVHGSAYPMNYYVTDTPGKINDSGWYMISGQSNHDSMDGLAIFSYNIAPVVFGVGNNWTMLFNMSNNKKPQVYIRDGLHVGNLTYYTPMTLPACNGNYMTAVNSTDKGLYYCNSTTWTKLN